MPGRTRPRQTIERSTAQHAVNTFSGALDGASAVPNPVSEKDLLSNTQKSPKLVFFHEEHLAMGGSQTLWLAHLPLTNSEHVYVCGIDSAAGTYREETQGWTREPGTLNLQVLTGANARPGDTIVVEYAYHESVMSGGRGFREIDLPNKFSKDDDSSVAFDLPFSFHGYTTVRIASNGVVKISDATAFTSYTMRNVWEHGYALAVYWADHDTRGVGDVAGVIRYGNVTVDGKTALVVTWDNVAIYGSTHTSALDNRRSRFQLVLFPDGVAEFNYDTIKTDCGAASGNGAGRPYIAPNLLEGLTSSNPSAPSAFITNIAGINVRMWEGPIIGYFTPGNYWTMPNSGAFSVGADTPTLGARTPTDPVYGVDYPKQGVFGFVDDGPYALASATNCGIAGRLKFSLGSRGGGLSQPTFNTYDPVSVTSGSTTTIIWANLPTGVGLVFDVVATAQAGMSSGLNCTIPYQYTGGTGNGAATFVTISNNVGSTYQTPLPISSGTRFTSAPMYMDPHYQPGGTLQISVAWNITAPVLRVLQVIPYVY